MATSTPVSDQTIHLRSCTVGHHFRLGRRPALDGLRAIAVLMVMAHHGYLPLFRGGSIGVDIFLYRLMVWDKTPIHRLLEAPPLVWIGRLSYGLYQWHFRIFEKVGGWKALGTLTILVAFALTFSIATLSFYFVETPFLKLKSRFKGA